MSSARCPSSTPRNPRGIPSRTTVPLGSQTSVQQHGHPQHPEPHSCQKSDGPVRSSLVTRHPGPASPPPLISPDTTLPVASQFIPSPAQSTGHEGPPALLSSTLANPNASLWRTLLSTSPPRTIPAGSRCHPWLRCAALKCPPPSAAIRTRMGTPVSDPPRPSPAADPARTSFVGGDQESLLCRDDKKAGVLASPPAGPAAFFRAALEIRLLDTPSDGQAIDGELTAHEQPYRE